jgi:[ribosomal protein S5]-alanine N-acetyltransferase
MIIVDTPRLILREFHLSDGDALTRVFGDAEVMKYGDGVKTQQWIKAWIARWIGELYTTWGFGMWASVEKSEGTVVGYCGLSRFPDRCSTHETEIGIRLERAYWGQGLATEAALAVRDYGLHTLRLPKLIAMIDPGNVASIRVVKKIGLHYEREVMLEDYDHPDHVYALGGPAGG